MPVYHVLVKGGLFLMLGAQGQGRRIAAWQLGLAGFTALGFAGLPLTGGSLGKLAFKDVAGGGATGVLFSLAAVGSSVLMLHFLRLVRAGVGDTKPASAVAWVATTIAATLLQWSLFAAVTGVSAAYALTPEVLFELAWPIAAGAAVAWGLAAAGTQLPRFSPGDIGAQLIAAIERQAPRLASLMTRFETQAHQWPVSTLTLAAALILFVALQAVFGPR